ncbi:MAG: hypothetical protein ACRET7_09120 [Burkholderiales bacterium]
MKDDPYASLVTPVFPGQVPTFLGLNCGEHRLARIDSTAARPGLNAMGDPEDDEEEEEEKKKPDEDEEEDNEDDNEGEEEEVPWQVR